MSTQPGWRFSSSSKLRTKTRLRCENPAQQQNQMVFVFFEGRSGSWNQVLSIFSKFIQTHCYLLHLIGSLQNALQYLQLEEPIESYRNLKPNKFHYRNLKFTKFHRIFLSFSLCPCSIPIWRSQCPNCWDFHYVPAAVHSSQSGPSCWFNIALLLDWPQNISPFQMKTYKLHPIINARFLSMFTYFAGDLNFPYTIPNKPLKKKTTEKQEILKTTGKKTKKKLQKFCPIQGGQIHPIPRQWSPN